MSEEERRPILRGERVYLRPAERADVPVFVEWFSDAEVVETLGARAPMSLASEEAWFEQLQADQGRSRWHFVICLRQEGQPIGTAGLHSVDPTNGNTELGIAIGERSRWDQGLGSETMELLLDFAFGELRLERVYLHVLASNARARHVYDKTGFQLEGTLRRSVFHHGRHHDVHVMSILKDEWLSQERPRSWQRD